jgi:hypothetical protein
LSAINWAKLRTQRSKTAVVTLWLIVIFPISVPEC